MLARDVHELRQASTSADEHCIVALLLHQFVDGDGFPDHNIVLELDTHLSHDVELLSNDRLWKPKFGNAVHEHSAEFMQCFEDVDLVTFLDEVARGRKS